MRGEITPDDLYRVRYVAAGISRARARALVGVSRRTWKRWETGQARIPLAAFNLLRLVAAGELPAAGPEWEGWRFFKGELFSPEGVGFGAGEIRALPLLHAYIAELEREYDLLKKKHRAPVQAPVPGKWRTRGIRLARRSQEGATPTPETMS